jgi:hypothetical protein
VTTTVQVWIEEERAEKIAEALKGLGLVACAEDTGGGIVCIVIPSTNGGAIFWGTADVTWGAAIMDKDGEQTASVTTEWPSDSEDIDATARALLEASLRNGAVQAGA